MAVAVRLYDCNYMYCMPTCRCNSCTLVLYRRLVSVRFASSVLPRHVEPSSWCHKMRVRLEHRIHTYTYSLHHTPFFCY